MTRSAFKKLSFFLVAIVLSGTLYLSTTYATLAPLTPPPSGGYDAGTNSILDPGCAPTDTDCFVKEFEGWKLTGNSGTTAGTNFIGTTDATDFMVKTNGNQIVLFGQNGNVAIGSANVGLGTATPIASGDNSFAWGAGTQASNTGSTAWGFNNSASASGSTVWGSQSTASGPLSTAWGADSIASGNNSTAFGYGGMRARSFSEIAFGFSGTDHVPGFNTNSIQWSDRLFSIGNGAGLGSEHNAYTLWKDGSFAYNDDNFQNDNLGAEQNMFYFNYGNHDGLGVAQTKRAIRLGSALNDEWDINSANVGDHSIVLGFANLTFGMPAPKASGINSLAAGGASTASGMFSTALGLASVSSGNMSMSWGSIDEFTSQPNVASGDGSTAFGEHTTASGLNSTAWGARTISSAFTSTAWGISSTASGYNSTAFGNHNTALSLSETVFGSYGTSYISVDDTNFNLTDRLVNIGNGTGAGFESDAFTILKNGETGIGIDNFEANTNGNIFQVGDGATNIIGYVDDVTGNWVAVSDERKKENITDLSYGLDQLLQLRPTSFDYKRNHEHTIGFIAQQVLPIIPEAVYGTENEGYGMSYATLTPVIVKSIQEMNLKITDINNTSVTNTWRDALIGWLADAANGITKIFAGEVETKKLCVSDDSGNKTCITKNQLDTLLNGSPVVVPVQLDPVSTPDPGIIDPETSPEPTPDPGIGDQTPAPDPTPDPGVVSPTE